MTPRAAESIAERLCVRVDATRGSGLGHLMRCIALAQAWQDAGGSARFIGRYAPDARERLGREQIECIELAAALTAAADLAATRAAIPTGSPIVLDGYGFDPGYQQGLAGQGRLLVIDDLGHWPAYAGRLLLNQNPFAADVPYGAAPATRLLGPAYALLDRDFAGAAPVDLGPGAARRWLVTLGGTDSGNATAGIGAALAAAAGDEVVVRLVIGPLNPHRAALERLAAATAALEIEASPASMCEALAWSDLAVSAAGTTALQLARLGVPTLLVAIADNQVPVGESLDRAKSAVYLGRWPGIAAAEVARAAIELSGDRRRRVLLSHRARELIDGSGAARVCRALAATAPQK